MAVQRYRKPDGTWGVLQGGNEVANVYLPTYADLTDDELAKNRDAFEKMKNGASVQFVISQDGLYGYYNYMYVYEYSSEDDIVVFIVDYDVIYASGTTITSVIRKEDWYVMYSDGSVVLEISASEELQGGGSNITVDSELSDTSENPLQNKVITEALNGKVEKAYVDNAIANAITTTLNTEV